MSSSVVSEERSTRETKEIFDEKITKCFTNAIAVFGIEIGTKTGLLQAMTTFTEPLSSHEIAAAKNYKERYVREWLGLMVTSEIVDITDDNKYILPEHRHDQFLMKNSISHFSPFMMMFAGIMPDLEQCFKANGPRGIPYSRYPGFQDWRESFTGPQAEWAHMEKQLSIVPDILDKLENGTIICDMGCATGTIPMTLAEKFPKSTIWGLEISEEGIARARETAIIKGLKNTEFHVQDICDMPSDWTHKFDFVTMFDVAHDVPHTTKMLREIVRVLKPGGYVLIVDVGVHTNVKDNIAIPTAPLLYGASLFHCMVVSLNEEGGEGWGTCWGIEKATELLKEAGFAEVNMHEGFQAVCRTLSDEDGVTSSKRSKLQP